VSLKSFEEREDTEKTVDEETQRRRGTEFTNLFSRILCASVSLCLIVPALSPCLIVAAFSLCLDA
jgi:hypothetical protein